jgi:AI-2 transport protein TqsA
VPITPPASLPRTVVVLLGMAAAAVVVAAMRSAAFVIGPTFLAVVLTISVHPLRVRLERQMPRWASSALCYGLLVTVLAALGLSILLAVARFAELAASYGPDFDETLHDLAARLEDLGVSADDVQPVYAGLDLGRISSALTDALSGVTGLLSAVVLVVTLLLFMTFDGAAFGDQVAGLAQRRPFFAVALTGLAKATRRWLVVSTAFGLIVAALDTVALAVLDVPAPLVWGLLAFLTNYIPNIGFFIGLVPPAILAYLDEGPGLMLAVILVYTVLNVVIQSIIQPKVVGDAVGLSATITFLSLVLWAWVLGPLGAVIAVPVSLMARALLVDADPAAHWVRPLIGDRAPRDPGRAPSAERRRRISPQES